MVLKRQSCLPVRTSKARTTPLVLLCVETVMPSRNDEPMITTSPTMAGVEWMPISPVSRSICSLTPLTTPVLRSTTPLPPKVLITAPVLALSETSR